MGDEMMNHAIKRIRPNYNWISAVLLTLFVASFAILAESHVRPDMDQTYSADTCTSAKTHRDRLFVRYH